MGVNKPQIVITDVDGVLTDGKISYANNLKFKSFNVKDGSAIKRIQKLGVKVIFMSGDISFSTDTRGMELDVPFHFCNPETKLQSLAYLARKHGVNFSDIIYIGDDMSDISCLSSVGYPYCPKDSISEVKSVATSLPSDGGCGVMVDIWRIVDEAREGLGSHRMHPK